jgi:redox-sensitive bicupin YhaK (pirin superfamily)
MTLTMRPAAERGHAQHGWLDSWFTFSFAEYYAPEHVHFGPLRVLNQDVIAPGTGFPQHGHSDMEIVTVVLEGELEHRDSTGNVHTLRRGDVQFMSAGTGIMHSEYNASQTEPLELLQMWVFPRAKGLEPRYDQRFFPEEERTDALRLVVSPDGADDSLVIGQDARLYVGALSAGAEASLPLGSGRAAWVHVARGRVSVGDVELGPGDGAAVTDAAELAFTGREPADLVVWDLPRE